MKTEKKEKKKYHKLWITLSLAAVFVIGVPIWWKSTEVYRADLPHSQIHHWSAIKPYHTPFEITLDIRFAQAPQLDLERFTASLNQLLSSHYSQAEPEKHPQYQFTLQTQTHNKSPPEDLFPLWDYLHAEFPNRPGKYSLVIYQSNAVVVPRIASNRAVAIPIKEWSTVNLQALANEIAWIVTSKLVVRLTEADKFKLVPNNPEFKLSFNLLQDSTGWEKPITSWHFEKAAKRYLEPFLNEVNITADFSVDSQIMHFVKLLRTPEQGPEFKFFNSSVLPHILAHPNEWNLDFIATTQPTVHFIVYVPSRENSPLYLVQSSDQLANPNRAYLIPQTAGVVIYNRNDEGLTEEIPSRDLTDIISIFLSQFRELLGVRPVQDPRLQVEFSPTGIADWELDQLVRQRTWENLQSATINLQSLSELAEQLTNMVILDNIRDTVLDSLAAIEQTQIALKERKLDEALAASRIAMEKAHDAFFDPNMLGMLYFPDEHKFAVYTPLFLPISIPMLLKLVSEVKKFRNKGNK